MSYPQALTSVRDLNLKNINHIIEQAFQFKKNGFAAARDRNREAVVLLAFFEPSTRTRVSFEIASLRLGLRPVNFVADDFSSVKKGESLSETLENLLAMRPDLLVCRHAGDAQVARILSTCKVPSINAGNGRGEHPTQALLDAMTVLERRGKIAGEKIVYVGDAEHSRVAQSGRILFELLGAHVAVAAPDELLPKGPEWAQCQKFSSLSDAASWATVCIGLRIQKERHRPSDERKSDRAGQISPQDYVARFRLDKRNLIPLSDNGLIMAPGPFVPDEDVSEEILSDSRCVIHEQVTNGVFIRAAVISEILGAR